MSSNLDKSLADVIATRPKNNNKRRASQARRVSAKSAKATLVGSPVAKKAAATSGPRARAQIQTQKQPAAAPHADKIIVSNLPNDVNEAQIKELFSMQIGPTKEVTLHYDHSGRSKGVASVQFSRRGDGTKAYQQYHNRLIDGKRPMKVEIVLDPSRAQPPPTLSQRVGPAPAAANGVANAPSATRGKKGARGRGGKKKGTERPPKTAEDLDAEMADYSGSTTTAAT